VMAEFQGATGALSDDQLQELAGLTKLGRWMVRTALWGDGPVVEHHLKHIRDAWEVMDGAKVVHDRTYGKADWHEIKQFDAKVQAGIPSLDLIEPIPDFLGHIGFSPVVPLVGTQVREVVDMMKEIVTAQVGSNFVCAIICINERSCIIVNTLMFDRTNEESVKNAFDTAKTMVKVAAEHGYGEYRAHIDFMDLASEQYSFNDHSYKTFIQTIKDAVDPNGVLSPGRHGIWPAAYRS